MIKDTPNFIKNKLSLGSYYYNLPSTFTPTINKDDLERGYIKRYFIGKRNFFDFIETNAKGFNEAETVFYTKVSIDWKITGPEYNIYKDKTLEITGVVNYNILRIKQAAAIIKGIETVLNNPRQFWRGY